MNKSFAKSVGNYLVENKTVDLVNDMIDEGKSILSMIEVLKDADYSYDAAESIVTNLTQERMAAAYDKFI